MTNFPFGFEAFVTAKVAFWLLRKLPDVALFTSFADFKGFGGSFQFGAIFLDEFLRSH